MKNSMRNAMACVGAVIGAGFASGREIMAFFSVYSAHSWWLVALTVLTMTVLCRLLLASRQEISIRAMGDLGQGCVVLVLSIAGGAMTSAAGQMIALVWNVRWAYWTAAVGTLLLAWTAGFCKTRVLGWLGSLLALALVCAVGAAMAAALKMGETVRLDFPYSAAELLAAGGRAVGYAAMNMTLAIGMVQRCALPGKAQNRRTSCAFGGMMALLLSMSNGLYLRHPQLEAFPIVRLLGSYGRAGFLTSALLLYLAASTTLISVLASLRQMICVQNKRLRNLLSLGLPLGLSAVGFSGIVERVYAPAGWLCLALIFWPLSKQKSLTSDP